jgi:hypothetical protein
MTLSKVIVFPDLDIYSSPSGPARVPCRQVVINAQVAGLQRTGLGATRADECRAEQTIAPRLQESAAGGTPRALLYTLHASGAACSGKIIL